MWREGGGRTRWFGIVHLCLDGRGWGWRGGRVAVDATVLDFLLRIDSPGGLARDAETGVVQYDKQLASGFEVCGGILKYLLREFHILQGKDDGAVGEVIFF